MKTHLQLNLLPQEIMVKPRIIHVVRNPRDAAVSYFHHHKNMHGYNGSMEEFLEDFLAGELPFGSYFRHLAEFSELGKRLRNVLLLRYEDFLINGFKVVKDVSKFLNIKLNDEDTEEIVDYLKFEKMKSRKNSNMEEITEFQKEHGNIKSNFRYRSDLFGGFK